MRKLTISTILTTVLMLLGLLITPATQPVLGRVSPPELTYPSVDWNATNVLNGPRVNNMVFTVLDLNGQTNAIISGAIDLMTDPSGLATTRVAQVSNTAGAIVRSQSVLGFRWMGFNYRNWVDPTLPAADRLGSAALTRYKAYRIAIDYLIPRADVVATRLGGNGFATCEAVSPAWGSNYWSGTGICRFIGGTASANRTFAKASLASLLGTPAGGGNVFTNITSGCTGVTTTWCFGNGTQQLHVTMNYPSYDLNRKYVGDNTAANARAIGFDLIPNSVPFATLVANLNAYSYSQMILAYGFGAPIPDWLYDTFASSQDTCPINATAGAPGCTANSPNGWGLHDSVLDGYLNTIHTSTNFAAIVTATQNALARLYTQAEWFGMYALIEYQGARVDTYNGYYNRPGQGIGDFSNWLFTQILAHKFGSDFGETLAHPSDDPSRPFTLGISSDIGYANRFELSSVWDVFVNNMYEGPDGLNYLGPDNFALYPMTANVPDAGAGTLTSVSIHGTPGLLLKYTVNGPAPGASGMPVWLANSQFVTVQDYKNTLDYMTTMQPAAFAALLGELADYNVTGNTLNMYLNQTGYWKLYDTPIAPTYAPYWCDKSHSGTPNCKDKTKNVDPTFEPAAGSADELAMMGASTTGPFIVTQHLPGTSFHFTRNTAYWLSPACDRISILGGPCAGPVISPVFGSGLILLLTAVAIPTALAVSVKRRLRK